MLLSRTFEVCTCIYIYIIADQPTMSRQIVDTKYRTTQPVLLSADIHGKQLH